MGVGTVTLADWGFTVDVVFSALDVALQLHRTYLSALLFAPRPLWEAPSVEQTGLALTGLPALTAAVRMHMSVCGKARQRFPENGLPVSLAFLTPASPIAQR